MSASNWARCPRCLRRAEREAERLRQEADAAYGVLSREQWLVRDADAKRAARPITDHTLREDYEFFGAEDGSVTAQYSGGCTACGLSLCFSHEAIFEGVDE